MSIGVMSRRPVRGDYLARAIPVVVILIHGAVIVLLMTAAETKPAPRTPKSAAAPIIMDLAPLPSSARAPTIPQKSPAAPARQVIEQRPLLNALSKEVANASVKLSVHAPLPKPARQKKIKTEIVQPPVEATKRDQAPSDSLEVDNSSENKTDENKAPRVGAASISPMQARQSWESEVLARLQQAKRYPVYSLRSKQEDRVLVRFTIDQDGRVLNSSIVDSQGYSALDNESLALIARVSPLPKPPVTAMVEDKVEMEVPIEFYIGRKS